MCLTRYLERMKHIFSFLAVAALGMAAAFGQCDADFDFMGAEFGISPNPILGETFTDGEVDQPYADVIHVILPASTEGIPEAPIALPLDSVVLDSILLIGDMGEALLTTDIGLSMYPNNNGDLPNPNAFLGGSQYCASLEGTPDTVGVFTGAIYTTAWVTVPFLGANAIPFPFEGYTLTINEPAIPGCMDDMACNYNPEANEDNGSCEYADPGLDCDGNCLLDADGDGICDPILGCTDAMACNYDASATEDDMSCEYAADYYDCDGMCLMDTDGDGVCDELEVAGCSDMTACNYDEMATDDDGSCTVVGDACDDGNDTTENDMIDENCECVGTEIVDRVDVVTATLEAFPNPAQEFLNIQFEGTLDGIVRLVTLDGRVAMEKALVVQGRMTLNVAHLPAGVYLLSVQHEAGQILKQVALSAH